jgi:UDP-N-acetylmuramyl pentapeptide synthase
MHQALIAFADLASTGKKIAVLGDMLELGKYSADEHKKLASLLNHTANYVFTVGIRTKKIIQELLDMGFDEEHLLSFDDSAEAGLELIKFLEPGDIVLVKGSQVMRMERVIEIIMKHPQDMEKLLVRQEKEWKDRD